MPVLTEAFKKKLPLKINLVKNKNKLLFPARDFVHIKDFLNIIFKILKNNSYGQNIMNVSNNKLIYLDTIINIFEKKLKKKITYKQRFYNKGNYNYTLGNNLKLKKKLKFNFKFTLNDIVKSCIKKKVI